MDTKGIILSIILSTTTGILAAVIWKRLRERSKKEWQFCIADLADPTSLVVKLGDRQNAVSQYLWWRLPFSAQPLVEKYDGSSPPPESLKQTLVGALNQLLADQFFFNEHRFEHVLLRAETQKLIAQGLQDDGIPSLNRMLIEDAYPLEIVKRARKRYLSYDARIVATILSIFVFVIILSTGISPAKLLTGTEVRGVKDRSPGGTMRPGSSATRLTTASDTNKLVPIIKQQQRVYVGESSGVEAPDNFTKVRLELFEKNGTVDGIVKSLEADPEFLKIVEGMRAMPAEEREALLQQAEVAYSPTWEQLDMDPMINSPEELRRGQTRAGQTAERMIAEGIVNQVRLLL